MVKKPSNPELGCLSDRSIDISPHLCRKVTVEGLTTYLEALAESVYESDPLKIR